MSLTYLIIAVVMTALCLVCEHMEQKSRRWYQDRVMLRGSGFFLALAIVALGFGIKG